MAVLGGGAVDFDAPYAFWRSFFKQHDPAPSPVLHRIKDESQFATMTIPSIPVLSPEDALGDAARSLYANHGILYIPKLLDDETTDRLRDVFTEQVERDPSITSETINDGINKDDILSRYPRFVHPHRHVGTEVGNLSRQLFFDHRLHDIAKNLVGPVYGAQSMFHFKPPTARGLAFHQNNYFLQNHPDTCLTAWIAVDHANEESGGLIVVPGTHKSEVICHGDTEFDSVMDHKGGHSTSRISGSSGTDQRAARGRPLLPWQRCAWLKSQQEQEFPSSTHLSLHPSDESKDQRILLSSAHTGRRRCHNRESGGRRGLR